jgi:DNA helicase-2/ATP-dependent DNA helicase PcrA
MTPPMQSHDDVDDHVDDEIAACLNLDLLRSFFLFAGAGSGKTRSLVAALTRIRETSGRRMRLRRQQVAVITYTNAACDEITSRLDFDPLVSVSTIHSFVWELINGFTADIRAWLVSNVASEIEELRTLELKGKGGKASVERQRSIEAKRRRLDSLPTIKRFVYSPTGDNRGRDSLNHAEVIKLGAHFLANKPLMQSLMINRYPILLIDESQDTNGLLMDAFLNVQTAHKGHFGVGLFGDTMQRIYSDGKTDLGIKLPPDWARPEKVMNHRCPKRVIRLINKIRAAVDKQVQQGRTDAIDGHVRLFICDASADNKFEVEGTVRGEMAKLTGDPLWTDRNNVKTLILEHQMAATRMGFLDLFKPLYAVDDFKTGLRDGSLPALLFFSHQVLPLVEAYRSKNSFAVASILRKYSPLISKRALEAAGADQLSYLKTARQGVDALMGEIESDKSISFRNVLQSIASSKLLEIPEAIYPFASEAVVPPAGDEIGTEEKSDLERLNALRAFLQAPFSQIKAYTDYVTGVAPFDTHQGVKGREFPRVMVVMNDGEAGGFMFGYEKLFGAKAKTKTDSENERIGKETGIDRTRRLLYVTCSRTQSSLALVNYSANPELVRSSVLAEGWFEPNEVEMFGSVAHDAAGAG